MDEHTLGPGIDEIQGKLGTPRVVTFWCIIDVRGIDNNINTVFKEYVCTHRM